MGSSGGLQITVGEEVQKRSFFSRIMEANGIGG